MPAPIPRASAHHFTKISLLAAVARNGVIGHQGRLPWHLPEDLRRFKRLTLGHPVIMGRKTYDSILQSLGKPLPGRENIVVTRSAEFIAPGRRSAGSIEAALAAASQAPGGDQVFVIGGAEIYRLAFPFATQLDMTEIDADFEGDARFPAYDSDQWLELAREAGSGEAGTGEAGVKDTAPPLRYAFVTYQRRPNPK
jgi:dihydrofolate reductase